MMEELLYSKVPWAIYEYACYACYACYVCYAYFLRHVIIGA